MRTVIRLPGKEHNKASLHYFRLLGIKRNSKKPAVVLGYLTCCHLIILHIFLSQCAIVLLTNVKGPILQYYNYMSVSTCM